MNAHRLSLVAAVGLGLAMPAAAEVKSATEAGFDIAKTVEIAAPPAIVYAALVVPSRWWNGAHSYSGKAANLSIDPRAGGCFCETLPDKGSVEHARVIHAQPGQMLRLQGGLGPLQAEAAIGTLSFALQPSDKGTTVEMRYVIGGYIAGGAAKLAQPVDQVMGEQLDRLKASVEGRLK